ncbi:MAG: DUF5711 family protein [Lachnospiraceae bacterium]
MSEDINKLGREEKKKRLRQKIVHNQELDDNEQLTRKLKSHKRKNFILLISGIFLCLVISLGIYIYDDNRRYKTYSVLWEQSVEGYLGMDYITFGSNVLQYSKDGASYVDESGKVQWSITYNMNRPIVKTQGDFVVIADQKGKSFIICSVENGQEGSATTSYAISKVAIANQGVVAVVSEDKDVSYIDYYKKNGDKLDISKKSPLTEGYPLDIALSPNGYELIASYLYVDSGIMRNKVLFYNFGPNGQEVEDRLVGSFGKYAETDTIIPKVEFLTNELSVAFGDNLLSFYSTKNEREPALLKEVSFERQVASVFCNDTYIGIVFDKTDEYPNQTMVVYTSSGNVVLEKDIDFAYKNIFFTNGFVVLYNANSCVIYDFDGDIRYNNSFDSGITTLLGVPEKREFALVTGDKLLRIKLK